MRYEEHNNQKAFVAWFRYQYPDEILFMINNGTNVSITAGARLKAMGMLAGMPDLMLARAKDPWHGLYIEMKSKKGRLSKKQVDIHEKLANRSYLVVVCYNWIEARDKIKEYLNELA